MKKKNVSGLFLKGLNFKTDNSLLYLNNENVSGYSQNEAWGHKWPSKNFWVATQKMWVYFVLFYR